MAAAHYGAGNYDAAWDHALRAYYLGSSLSELLANLQRVSPRSVDLTKPPINPRVAVRAEQKTTAVELLASDRLVAILWNLAATSEVMHGGWSPASSDLLIRLRITDGTMDLAQGSVSLSGVITLEDRQGHEHAETRFHVDDVMQLEATVKELLRPFQKIEEAVAAFHRDTRR